MHNINIVGSLPTLRNAANGSACSQLIEALAPLHDDDDEEDALACERTFSGKDSGTATSMKNTSNIATDVANATTKFSLHASIKYAPNAGDITILAANVADTYIFFL